jgi:hypothetical protein
MLLVVLFGDIQKMCLKDKEKVFRRQLKSLKKNEEKTLKKRQEKDSRLDPPQKLIFMFNKKKVSHSIENTQQTVGEATTKNEQDVNEVERKSAF